MLNRFKATLVDFFQQADLMLLGFCCVSTLYGMVLIFSATRYKDSNRFMIVQAAAMILGICMYVFISMIDLDAVIRKWKWILGFNLIFILLLKTPFGVGAEEYGNNAWLKFPGLPVSIGPAEVVKITFTLLLAKQLEWLKEEKHDLKSFFSAFSVAGHTLLLMGIYVAVSGDMGNGLTFFFIFLCMAFAAGFALRWFVLLFTAGGAALAAAWVMEWIPDYMRRRVLVVFDHTYDVQDKGWQQTRGLLALGSGGVFGQGYLNGTQTQSPYSTSLPFRWTDFIFSVCGEELGMVGCIAIIVLLAAIIFRVLIVARNAQTEFYRLICVGMAAMLIFQTLINVGMCLFVVPVIGITLPFFSYGGSSIVTLYTAMGVVSAIKKNSPTMQLFGRT